MSQTVRLRFWLEATAAVLYGVALTLTWPGWIERAFGFEPDGGNGSTEWLIVVTLAAIFAMSSLIAGREWRHARRSLSS